MKVAHLKRAFLLPTETFVYTQMSHSHNTDALALTRDFINPADFPGMNVRAFTSNVTPANRYWADFSYKALRRMSVHERQFYCDEIASFKPDLFHAHYLVDAAYFADVIRRFDIPLVVSCYGYDVSSFPNRYFGMGKYYLNSVWPLADSVLAMSEDMRRDLLDLGCPSGKLIIHYYGIDLTRFTFHMCERSCDPVRILFLGSLGDERKGVEYLLQAFAQVVRLRPNTELRLTGNGRFRDKYKRLSDALRLNGCVTFPGFIPHHQVPAELWSADIFCHPSITTNSGDKEGIPGTVVEAMATGLPVVSTTHAGIPEMVEDGKHGFLVPEQDVDALAAALIKLVDNPALRKRLGSEASRQANEKADAVKRTLDLESIYKRVVAEKRTAQRI